MTNEEREELRAALEAAGCHRLASRVCYFDDPMVAELRSLLRREERLATMEAGVRAADRIQRLDDAHGAWCGIYEGNTLPRFQEQYDRDREAVAAAAKLLETEVPDGQD